MTQPTETKPKVLSKNYKVTHYDADPFGNAKPSSLMNYMQDASSLHAKEWGVSVFDLFKEGKTWVISRYHLKIFNRPAIGKDITVRTWPSFVQRAFALREFEAVGPDGGLVAAATISVAIIDLQSKRAIPIGNALPADYLTPKRAMPEEFGQLPAVVEPTRDVKLPVMIRDLDINGHVNHVVYAQWALESVPVETWNTHHLSAIELNFKAEVRHGASVLARSSELAPNDTSDGQKKQYAHQILLAEGTPNELTRARTTWVKKVPGTFC